MIPFVSTYPIPDTPEMYTLTVNEIRELSNGHTYFSTLVKLQNLSRSELGRYLENQDFQYWLHHDVGVKTGDCRRDIIFMIQAWVKEGWLRILNMTTPAECQAVENEDAGGFKFYGDNLIAL
ncbi:hypothetical protein HYE67_011195 [Fusarium culmorum]|uniref:Uncharacterized protein n=1 Tax=Fusarium culmorum TaxID=5516 RepID=A0A2T4GHP8_FUSCU|nr:hypothetical protein FCULG_00009279 [Fusarium culmorum]QPC68964.1 hypothetical protein HYE67_011195 [Fusarium culmorum]